MTRFLKTPSLPVMAGFFRSTFLEMLTVTSVAAFLFIVQACTPEAPEREKSTQSKASILEESASAIGDKATPHPTERITKAELQAVDPTGQEPMDEAITCLARSIYWEARGEDLSGMQAIANVVMNRLAHGGFPNTICGVVKQGQERGACQFSWWCDGHSDKVIDTVLEQESYQAAKEISRKALNKQLKDLTHGALYFHHKSVKPSWAKAYGITVTLGKIIFYKPSGGDAR